MRGIKAQIKCITCRPHVEGLFTTSLLVPSFAFKYYTFLLEFTKKDNFPQFKPPMTCEILQAFIVIDSKMKTPRFVIVLSKSFFASTSSCSVMTK
jgi:hypothetical protein